MRIQRRWMITATCALALLANVVGVIAQSERPRQRERDVYIERSGGAVIAGGQADHWTLSEQDGDGNTFVFVSGEMSFDGKTVKGAPYSAQAISESIQTLADGNRIVHKTTASVYRDGEGRTRRDQTLKAIGPYASAGDPPQTTFINDPVAGVNYILDSRTRTARKIDFKVMKGGRGERVVVTGEGAPKKRRSADADINEAQVREHKLRAIEETVVAGGPALAHAPRPGATFEYLRTKPDPKNTKKESLGKQTIEGVEAEGTRLTITIPAGEIGNELPMQLVTESWYSPELQTVIMSKHTDPRMGEHTYRLTNITLGEPARSLFEVPADYAIKETIPGDLKFKIEREMQESKRKPEEKDF
ncbi:MAG TPA: hypothetical protein VKA70_18955 [Blastocatellia bacterium]|nr:hypothetical protein [Blastocatellia bacterium]